MKYIKTYEQNINPKLYDYVICDQKSGFAAKVINNFFSNNIGQIIEILKDGTFLVEFSSPPDNIQSFFNDICVNCRKIFLNEIKYISNNKEELKIKISTNKYNL